MEQKHLHYGHRERLRKQATENGLDSLHEHQVLEYLLTFTIPQKDTNDLAHALINKFGSFSAVLDADINSLKQVKGVGDVVAHFLAEYKQFALYYQRNRPNQTTYIRGFQTSKTFVLPLLSNVKKEELYLICIDGNNKVVSTRRLKSGTENQISVSIKEITDTLISLGITNFIIAHNHPDGPCVPSAEDNKFTKNLVFTMSSLNITLLDHLIVGVDDVYSYYGSGLLQEFRKEAARVLNVDAGSLAQNSAKYTNEEGDL